MKRRLRRSATTPHSSDNLVRWLHDGGVALPAMLDLIRSATHEVLVEMYWFDSDRTGKAFAQALMERAQAGVCVRVVYDAVGSLTADDNMFEEMRRAGCEVEEYNPIAPWRARFNVARISRRNHRKLVVVDGRVAITGGINIGDPWAPKDQGGGGFRDDAVEIRGGAARELRRLFYRTFRGEPTLLPPDETAAGHCEVVVLASDLLAERRDIYKGYLRAIARASRDILITNSYFIPTSAVRRALLRAVRRGVRVRVLVPRNSDVKIAQYASRACYEQLLRGGVEIYEWLDGVLHGKTAAVDDVWCTAGSFNFDARSLHNNLELNVAIINREATAALRHKVEQDLLLAERVELERFQRRGLATRMVESLSHSLRWLL